MVLNWWTHNWATYSTSSDSSLHWAPPHSWSRGSPLPCLRLVPWIWCRGIHRLKKELNKIKLMSQTLIANKTGCSFWVQYFLRKDCVSEFPLSILLWLFFFLLNFCLYFAIYIAYVYSMIYFLNFYYADIHIQYCSSFELFELLITWI